MLRCKVWVLDMIPLLERELHWNSSNRFTSLCSAFATRFLVRITPKNVVGFVAQEDGFVARSALPDSGHDEIVWHTSYCRAVLYL